MFTLEYVGVRNTIAYYNKTAYDVQCKMLQENNAQNDVLQNFEYNIAAAHTVE